MTQDHTLTVDELIRECGDLRGIDELRNQASLRTASGQPIIIETLQSTPRRCQ